MTTVHVSPKSDLRGARTVARHHENWLENAKANGDRGKLNDLSLLWMDAEGPEAVSVAAGPSLEADIRRVAEMREGRELIVVDAAARYVVEAGLTPDYIVTTDASEKIRGMFDVLPPLPETKLIANVIADPAVIDAWQGGPVYWFTMSSQYFSMAHRKMLQDVHGMVAKVGTKLVPGGNVSSMALSFLLSVRNSKHVHLFGHDFCWRDYMYCGAGMRHLEAERMATEGAAGTIYKRTDNTSADVWTNASLERYAAWHHDAATRSGGRVTNHTSSTILRLA